MTDRELTERIARGLGGYQDYTWIDTPFFTGLQRRNFDSAEHGGLELQTSYWAPLEDERDAFRLAVRLRIDIRFEKQAADHPWSVIADGVTETDEHQSLEAATCRAIVRAADQAIKDVSEGKAT